MRRARDWLTEARFPDARERRLGPLDRAAAELPIDPDTFVASVTPGHAHDLKVVQALHAAGRTPRYLGVIGSKRKAVELRKELVASGMSPADAEAIHIPMGLDIGAADPPEIAVSIVAQLVAVLREEPA